MAGALGAATTGALAGPGGGALLAGTAGAPNMRVYSPGPSGTRGTGCGGGAGRSNTCVARSPGAPKLRLNSLGASTGSWYGWLNGSSRGNSGVGSATGD
jgi:hypothetical protein